MKKICFVGGGNMATALLTGLRKSHPTLDCHIIEPFAPAREKLAAFAVTVHESANRAAIDGADAVVLATKPQVLKTVCSELLPCLNGELIVSIAAGTRSTTLSRWLGGHARIVRTMPNTPALIGQGITGLYAPETLFASDVATATELMCAMGVVVRVESEAMIDSVTAVSGSGPAYVFYFIESLRDAALALGFSEEQARQLAIETVVGAAALAAASREDVSILRQRVTSRGGTTEAALNSLDADKVKTAFVRAIKAADARGRELGDLLGKD